MSVLVAMEQRTATVDSPLLPWIGALVVVIVAVAVLAVLFGPRPRG